jgi:hypothetical protein
VDFGFGAVSSSSHDRLVTASSDEEHPLIRVPRTPEARAIKSPGPPSRRFALAGSVRQYSGVLLCFVDESFKSNFYGFGAVVADEEQTRTLTTRMNDIVSPLVEYGVEQRAEVHAHPVFHGKGAWEQVPPRVRVKVFIDVVDAVRTSGATVLLRGVPLDSLRTLQDARRYRERHTPEQVGFLLLLQRVDELASRRGEYALVIADERDDRERHRERFAMYQAFGTPGTYMHTRLERLLDTVHFAPSHHSRMLQVADVLAFAWVRSQTVAERDARKQRIMRELVDSIEANAFSPGCWPPR